MYLEAATADLGAAFRLTVLAMERSGLVTQPAFFVAPAPENADFMASDKPRDAALLRRVGRPPRSRDIDSFEDEDRLLARLGQQRSRDTRSST